MGNNEQSEALVIDRHTGQLSLVERKQLTPLKSTFVRNVSAIVGNIQLIGSKYLILVSESVYIGDISGEAIYRIEQVEIFAYRPDQLHLSEEQKFFESQYVSMVEAFFKTPGFYFSYTYDLSYNLQQIATFEKDFFKRSIYERVSFPNLRPLSLT